MAPSRTARSMRNISVGMLMQFATTLFSIVTRTCLIKWIGTGAVGLNGLFSEVIGMLSMAEMGVGAAIIYNLYAPLVSGDTRKISQLMNLYKAAYSIIAAVTFVIGCGLTPFIQHIVKKVDYSTSYVQTVFFLFVCKSSLSYLFSYKFSLLNADQKRYIESLVTLIVRAIGLGAQVAALYFTRNYICYMLVSIAETLIVNLVGAWYVNRHYPYLRSHDHLPKDERHAVLKNVRYIFIKKLSGKVTNSTDNILISTLVNTLQVGLYSNYTVIYSVIRQGCGQVSAGLNGSMGNLMVSVSGEQCAQTLRKITFAFFCVAFPAMLCLYAGVDTLIELWIGAEYLLEHTAVMLTCLILGIEILRTPLWQILEVSGLFHRDMWISIAGSSANLAVSIILGRIYGMVGVFIGTLCTYAIQLSLKIPLLHRGRWALSPARYYRDWAGYIIAFAGGLLAVEAIIRLTGALPLWPRLFVQVGSAGVLSVLAIGLFWGWTSRFRYVLQLGARLLRKLGIKTMEGIGDD